MTQENFEGRRIVLSHYFRALFVLDEHEAAPAFLPPRCVTPDDAKGFQAGAAMDLFRVVVEVDRALFLAPLVHEFGWAWDDWDRLAAGVLVGRLLECSGQSVGGNLSGDWSTIPDPWNLPYPIAEVSPDATALITKPAASGGRVDLDTVRRVAEHVFVPFTVGGGIRDVDDIEVMELALVENLQRKDLTAFEEAEALHQLALKCDYTHEEMARKLGKSQTAITESLSLNNMPEAIKRITGGAPVTRGRVTLDIPPLVENGFLVPMSVSVDSPMTSADHVKAIHVFTERNPLPETVSFHLGPRAGRAFVATRVRMADTQNVIAIAELSDGSYWSDTAFLIVTLAACLEELPA